VIHRYKPLPTPSPAKRRHQHFLIDEVGDAAIGVDQEALGGAALCETGSAGLS